MSRYLKQMACFVIAAMPANAFAQPSTVKTLTDFVECKLSVAEVEQFGEKVNAGEVAGFAQSNDGGGAALMLWKSDQSLSAWGENSNYINFPNRQEMHLAYKVPEGQEIKIGEALAARIGGMQARPDLEDMKKTYGWEGMDSRKSLAADKTLRVLVDVTYAPGWVTVGCGYGDGIQ
nr:hypothetical protein [uncultured Shinella sp.]